MTQKEAQERYIKRQDKSELVQIKIWIPRSKVTDYKIQAAQDRKLNRAVFVDIL